MKTLIFDLDGTIVDCKKLHQDGFRWAVTQQVPDIIYSDDDVEGLPSTEKIKYLQSKGYAVTEHADQLKRDHTRKYIDDYVKFNPALHAHFNRLYLKYKLCLASNSRSEFVFRCLNILNIWQFECVFTRNYGPSKPNPWMYNECMRITESSPVSTVIFEDSPIGIAGAATTGATVVAVQNSTHLIDILHDY